jgi:ankyrin repeat protein
VNIVEALIVAGSAIEAATTYGWRPLMMAAANGQTEVARLLLKAGAFLDAASDQDTAMTWAAAEGRIETLRFLLEQGANPNGPTHPEMSRALWTAVSYDRSEVIRLLAQHGADLEVMDRFGDTALARASLRKDGAAAKALLAAGATDTLHDAAARGDQRVVELLITPDALMRTNQRGQTPLHRAAFGGHGDIVERMLVEPGIKVTDPPFEGVLSAAAGTGSLPIVTLLIERGCNITELGNRPLASAVASGSVPIARKLLERGADPNAVEEGWPVLFTAVHAQDVEMTRALLESGADVNQKGPEDSELREALECNGPNEELLGLLRHYGFDPG